MPKRAARRPKVIWAIISEKKIANFFLFPVLAFFSTLNISARGLGGIFSSGQIEAPDGPCRNPESVQLFFITGGGAIFGTKSGPKLFIAPRAFQPGRIATAFHRTGVSSIWKILPYTIFDRALRSNSISGLRPPPLFFRGLITPGPGGRKFFFRRPIVRLVDARLSAGLDRIRSEIGFLIFFEPLFFRPC